MKLNRFLFGCIVVMLTLCICFSGWLLIQAAREKNTPADAQLDIPTTEATAEATTEVTTEATEPAPPADPITVAIFPNLPDYERCLWILNAMWEDIEPNWDLEFIYWDCYDDPYPDGIDVITYDALFLDYLVEYGYIQPLDPESVQDTTGILPFAMEGSRYDGNLYGLPFLACSNFLIHYADDEEMAQVQNFEDLYQVLSERKEWDSYDGLQIGYNDYFPIFYLDALMDYTGTYTTYKEAPSMYEPNEDLINHFLAIETLIPEASEEFDGWHHVTRFAQGEGSACYSYSEAFYDLVDIADQLTIRSISFFEGENIPLYFADIASVGSHVENPEKKEACIKLINLLASSEFQAALCYGSGEVQYLLPAREQVYLSAMEYYPIYDTFYTLATDENNRIFRFGSDIYDYMDEAYSILQY